MARKTFELEFSDNSFGCEKLGYIVRPVSFDEDEEDAKYAKHLKAKGLKNVKVVGGKASYEE